MSPHHHRIEHRRGGDDNDSTARFNAGPAVMNDATDGLKPMVINNDYHQRLSPTAAKTAGEGWTLISIYSNGKFFFILCETEALQLPYKWPIQYSIFF